MEPPLIPRIWCKFFLVPFIQNRSNAPIFREMFESYIKFFYSFLRFVVFEPCVLFVLCLSTFDFLFRCSRLNWWKGFELDLVQLRLLERRVWESQKTIVQIVHFSWKIISEFEGVTLLIFMLNSDFIDISFDEWMKGPKLHPIHGWGRLHQSCTRSMDYRFDPWIYAFHPWMGTVYPWVGCIMVSLSVAAMGFVQLAFLVSCTGVPSTRTIFSWLWEGFEGVLWRLFLDRGFPELLRI